MGDDGGSQQNVQQQQVQTTVQQSTNVVVQADPLVGLNTGRIADALIGLSKLTSYSFNLGLLDYQQKVARQKAEEDRLLLNRLRNQQKQQIVNRYIFNPLNLTRKP